MVGLTKDFATRRAIEDVSFDLRAGEIFGFVGSNGAGKTTTMRIILGVTAPSAGEVLVDGRPVSAADRSRIGYMPEERGLYPKMKVHQQLVYLARLHGLDRATAERNASEWEEKLQITQYRNDSVEALSLGNQQRVQLAAALTHKPGALVLDEPFSGLDPLAVDAMSQALRETADQGVPVLFSSHQLDLVERLSDRVGILASGRMMACGTIAKLRAAAERRTLFEGSAPALEAVRAAAGQVTPHGDGLLVSGAPTDPEVRRLAEVALATGGLHTFTAYHEPLSLMYRSVVEVSPSPEPEVTVPPKRRWWQKGGAR